MAEPEYIKLTPPRQRGGFAVASSYRSNLWLGKDHLLCVETEGYTESYKRFYFRDIQAITLRKNSRWLVLAVVTGLMTGFFGFIVLAKWIFGIIGGICAIPFLVNFLYGPSCACQLRTAVQTEDLPSMSRVRRARRVITRIRPLIAEAQGQLSAEEIPLRLQGLVSSPTAVSGEPPVMATTNVPPPATS